MPHAKADDREWLSQALARYERPLVGYALRLLGNLETARDVAQDCFLRLCRQRREKVEGHLAEWLFTVCRNRAIDHLRKDGRMHTLDAATFDGRVGTEEAPTRRVERSDETTHLLDHVAALPPRQQEVIRLRFQDGLSYREIAQVMQATVGNVGFLIHTAIKTLRARLADPVSPLPRRVKGPCHDCPASDDRRERSPTDGVCPR